MISKPSAKAARFKASLYLFERLRSLFRAKRGMFFAPDHACSVFPAAFSKSTVLLIHSKDLQILPFRKKAGDFVTLFEEIGF